MRDYARMLISLYHLVCMPKDVKAIQKSYIKSIAVDKSLHFVLLSAQPGPSWSASFTVRRHCFRHPAGC